jgi:hypothetical protein
MKINTISYYSQANGITERFNAALCQTLSMYTNENQNNWDEYINVSLFAYRASENETTQKTLFCLLYGREPRFPNNLDTQVKWLS